MYVNALTKAVHKASALFLKPMILRRNKIRICKLKVDMLECDDMECTD